MTRKYNQNYLDYVCANKKKLLLKPEFYVQVFFFFFIKINTRRTLKKNQTIYI